MNDIKIYQVNALTDNYIWIIVNTRQQSALIVDPGDATPALAFLKQYQLELKGILITHHHWDHVNGVGDILQHYPVPVLGGSLSQLPLLTHKFKDGEVISVDACFPQYQVLAIPGHTLDHIAYYADNSLFCGDTLFGAGCGRLFEGTAEQMYASLQKITSLPEQTEIYCAHEYTLNNLVFAETVEPDNQNIKQRIEKTKTLRKNNLPSLPSLLLEEKQSNPFLRCEIPAVIQQTERHSQRSLKQPVDVFTALRQWKDHF